MSDINWLVIGSCTINGVELGGLVKLGPEINTDALVKAGHVVPAPVADESDEDTSPKTSKQKG